VRAEVRGGGGGRHPGDQGPARRHRANAIERVYGILNGTCNYILSTMEDTGARLCRRAGRGAGLGFAEADPASTSRVDAAHKLAILAAIAFGTKIDFAVGRHRGITPVRAADIAQADALGFVIRLIGDGRDELTADGPPPVPARAPLPGAVRHPLAHVDGATNAVVAEGNFSGRLLFQGAGAGDGPTASAVVADLIDIARGDEVGAPFSIPVARAGARPCPGAGNGARDRGRRDRRLEADRPGR
jgi:homoserine dehydrogenase